MARKSRLVIPVFIPFGGCPHLCVFCNQGRITGSSALPDTGDVIRTIEDHLSTWKGKGHVEVAFYGGSFTGLESSLQEVYLRVGQGFIERGLVNSLRVSTRPDYVTVENMKLLRGYGVETVELGVQSMDDGVLKLSGRGHTSGDTVRAVSILRSMGFTIGLQLMPGLPGDTHETMIESATRVSSLGPDFVRVYPTLVLKDTDLHRMYLEGSYRPWPLEEMVRILNRILAIFKDSGVVVARVGLQPTEGLRESLVEGPFHPSIRQLAERVSFGT